MNSLSNRIIQSLFIGLVLCACQNSASKVGNNCTLLETESESFLCCSTYDNNGNLMSNGSFITEELNREQDSLERDTLPIKQHLKYDINGKLREITYYGLTRKKYKNGVQGKWYTEPRYQIILSENGDTNLSESFFYTYNIDTISDSITHQIRIHAKDNNVFFLDFYNTKQMDSLITMMDTTNGYFQITRHRNEEQPYIGRAISSRNINGKLQHKFDIEMPIEQTLKKKKACT